MNKLNLMLLTSLNLISLHSFADNESYNNATNAGQSLGALLSSQGSGVTSSDAGNNALDALGTNVTATGSESSMQKSNMGAAGTLSSSFNFEVKPKCIDTDYYPLLHGSYIKVPCSNSTGLIAASVCINDENNSVDCNVSTNYRPINLPTNGNTVTDYGYQFTGKCNVNGDCNGKMTQNAQVSTNADNINQQSIDTAKKSGLYDMIASGYVGKDGYSKQQAYMKSFGDGGSNNIFAKCTNDISGVLQNGVYYSCDHNESDSFSGQCTIQKVCTDWELIHHDTVTNKTCTLTSGSKDIQCQRIVHVEIKTKIIPPQDIPFNGSGKTDWRSEAYHSGAHFTFPMTGTLKSFSITSHGNWGGHYWVHLPPIVSTIDTTYGSRGQFGIPIPQNPISLSYSNLNIPITQGEQGQLSADGREYAYVPDMTIDYNGVIEIPQKIEKYPVITTEIQC